MGLAAAPLPPGPLRELDDFVDRLGAEDLHRVPAPCLGEDLVALRRGIDRLEAEFARRLAVFDRKGGYAASGAVSATAWLRGTCRLSGPAAAERVRLARNLEALPATAEAFAAGELAYGHAAVISRSADEVGPELARDAESILLKAAREVDPGRLRKVGRHLRFVIDPDGGLAAAERAHELRRLHLSQTYDGMWVLDALLDAEGGAMLHAALEPLCKPLPGDRRKPWQIRCDGLLELARRQLQGGGLPEVAGQRPHLTVTADLAVLQGGAGAGETECGQPLPGETVRRLACDASVTRVLLGPSSEPLDVGRATRVIPAALRRALVVRDRGCAWPGQGGCDRPPAWCDGHHIHAWEDGGPTNLSNTCLLCQVHHRKVHEGRWRLVRLPDGRLQARPP